MLEIDWKMIVDISQVIASGAVAFALWYTIKTFSWAKRADQIKLAEGVFKDLREMQRELHRDAFDSTDWDTRFFNTLEWFSFLINAKTIKDTKIKSFFKEALIDWHDNLLQNKDKNDPTKYPEFKKLYKVLKNEP
jgi:uncharacterized protein YutD